MAGLSSDGFSIKRLAEVISDRQASARNYFGNDAAVGVNDVLGRALRIHSPAEADLWELAEAVYNSFNPAVATGNQLDVIVSYAGLTRFEAAPSTATLLVTGDYNTFIPSASAVTSSFTSEQFDTTESVTLNKTSVSGTVVEPLTAVESQVYSVTLGTDTYSYTALSGDTTEDVAAGLSAAIDAAQGYTSSVTDITQVDVSFVDVFVPKNLTVSTGMTIRKVSKLVSSQADEDGEIEQVAGTLDTIASPVTGWDSVTNPEAAALGRSRETDEELRVRFSNAKEANAKGTIDAIYSNLLLVQGVEGVQVYQNVTDATDANGLPAHSYSVVILGGNSQEIADTMWDVGPAGINTYGNTTVSAVDSQGISHEMNFSRPVEVDIFIDITVSEAEGETIPSDAADQIKEALITYFESNLSVGNDVIYSRLFIPIQSVQGVQVDALTIGESASPTGTTNIVIDFDEISNLVSDNITVIVS